MTNESQNVAQGEADPRAAFVVAAIEVLSTPERPGVHVVYSGFNEEFRARFGVPSQETTDAMAAAGTIILRPARGGPIMYLPQNAPAPTEKELNRAKLAAI